MGKLIKIIFILAVAYGIYWTATNVDFQNLFSDTTTKIKNEKTINRVTAADNDYRTKHKALTNTRLFNLFILSR